MYGRSLQSRWLLVIGDWLLFVTCFVNHIFAESLLFNEKCVHDVSEFLRQILIDIVSPNVLHPPCILPKMLDTLPLELLVMICMACYADAYPYAAKSLHLLNKKCRRHMITYRLKHSTIGYAICHRLLQDAPHRESLRGMIMTVCLFGMIMSAAFFGKLGLFRNMERLLLQTDWTLKQLPRCNGFIKYLPSSMTWLVIDCYLEDTGLTRDGSVTTHHLHNLTHLEIKRNATCYVDASSISTLTRLSYLSLTDRKRSIPLCSPHSLQVLKLICHGGGLSCLSRLSRLSRLSVTTLKLNYTSSGDEQAMMMRLASLGLEWSLTRLTFQRDNSSQGLGMDITGLGMDITGLSALKRLKELKMPFAALLCFQTANGIPTGQSTITKLTLTSPSCNASPPQQFNAFNALPSLTSVSWRNPLVGYLHHLPTTLTSLTLVYPSIYDIKKRGDVKKQVEKECAHIYALGCRIDLEFIL
jgi:hypothetical protein